MCADGGVGDLLEVPRHIHEEAGLILQGFDVADVEHPHTGCAVIVGFVELLIHQEGAG